VSMRYANVMSTVAVFFSLAGGAYAVTQLPARSVGAKQLKRDAVSSSKVRDSTLRAQDFRPQDLQKLVGPKGDTGAKGDPALSKAFYAQAPLDSNGAQVVVPAGNYVAIGSIVARNPSASGADGECTLSSDADPAKWHGGLATSHVEPKQGDREGVATVSPQGVLALPNGGTVKLNCSAADGTLLWFEPSLTAIQVGSITP
jgi:hypothetical protein